MSLSNVCRLGSLYISNFSLPKAAVNCYNRPIPSPIVGSDMSQLWIAGYLAP
ncbi:hypothetical protein TorRG33x02_324970, partial [Trema orientale]